MGSLAAYNDSKRNKKKNQNYSYTSVLFDRTRLLITEKINILKTELRKEKEEKNEKKEGKKGKGQHKD